MGEGLLVREVMREYVGGYEVRIFCYEVKYFGLSVYSYAKRMSLKVKASLHITLNLTPRITLYPSS